MVTTTATIGFPRIGSQRQMKTALEAYWAGKMTEVRAVRG